MTDPKPCPVCGGTEFGVDYEERDERILASLICDDCDENNDTRGPFGKPCATEDEAEAEAVLAWNRFVDEKARGV
jgi:hypothetical protein